MPRCRRGATNLTGGRDKQVDGGLVNGAAIKLKVLGSHAEIHAGRGVHAQCGAGRADL